MKKLIQITINPDTTNNLPILTISQLGVKIIPTYEPISISWEELDEFIEMLHESRRERHRYMKEESQNED